MCIRSIPTVRCPAIAGSLYRYRFPPPPSKIPSFLHFFNSSILEFSCFIPISSIILLPIILFNPRHLLSINSLASIPRIVVCFFLLRLVATLTCLVIRFKPPKRRDIPYAYSPPPSTYNRRNSFFPQIHILSSPLDRA